MGVLCIDPAIGSMGWAYWTDRFWKCKQEPHSWGLVRAVESKRVDPDEDWWVRANVQVQVLNEQINPFIERIHIVHCEIPIFFGGTAGGVAAAETGSLQKLSFFVGMLGREFQRLNIKFRPISVFQWKGQLPKKVVEARIRKTYPVVSRKFKADVFDAVGIGLHLMGKL